MPKKEFGGQVFTVRPDRVDFRDFPYRPPLRNLPNVYPDLDAFQRYVELYLKDDMVLQQGDYGACTGFGLASVINYLKWEEARLGFEREQLSKSDSVDEKLWKARAPRKVSESMLYLNARLYDEWPGDDYEGSSCRGAVKGWHKHGVCSTQAWPYIHGKKDGPGRPDPDDDYKWRAEATEVVLGAYYRIDQKSIVDMQAAIHEIHAIYVAAEAHDGWMCLEGGVKTWEKAVIVPPKTKNDRGGHAFVIVGYTRDGFIIQNSWGPKWGYYGFALLPYTDWVEFGYDAWALALGAPIASRALPRGISKAKAEAAKIHPTLSPIGFSDLSLQERVREPAGWSLLGPSKKGGPKLPSDIRPWTDDDVTNHVIVSTVDGAPVRQMPVAHSAVESVQIVARKALKEAQDNNLKDMALVIHGGLNTKDDGFVRAGFMGPWFLANGIVPIFPIWQTDGGTSLLHAAIEALGLDELAKWIVARGPSAKPDDVALDRHIEDVARHSPGKAAWSEMKNKARGLSEAGGALQVFIEEIAKAEKPPAIHLIGHSAGAIVAGCALDMLKKAGLQTKTVSLYAPACTAELANDTFGVHLKSGGYLKSGSVHIDYLTDRRERLDPCVRKLGVTLYSKSLLFLVSRAFEAQHKTPILGLERTLTHDRKQILDHDAFHKSLIDSIFKWQATMSAAKVGLQCWDSDHVTVTVNRPKGQNVTEPNLHGVFDNNVDCVNATIARILGQRGPKPVKDLNFGGG